MIDGAQQCSVLQVISCDIDGIIHRHSCCAELGCLFFFVRFVLRVIGFCIKRLSFSQRAVYTDYFILVHVFTKAKIILLTHFCETRLYNITLCSTRFEHAEYDYEEVECLCCPIMSALSAM